jgi:tRNA dimethylallyltransferase
LIGDVPLIVILGPTAVGKTGLAIELADALNGEIIGADSRQIFRYMDIGTAKPTPEQRIQIPHHLIDVIDPDESLGLAQYQHLAYTAIQKIMARGRIPFLVGGTGQYITAVVEGWTIPQVAPNDVLRAELETYAAEHGSEALHTRLQAVDPVAANNIHHKNVRRVVRALEVSIEAGQPISLLQHKNPPPFRILQYGLTMREKAALLARADQRVDEMMQQGFLEEVQSLLDRGYSRALPSMSGLGYRELSSHLLDEIPLDESVAATKLHTHDFIRRQYTWFRGHDSGILWQNIEDIQLDQLIANIRQSL